jgi:hypothetical protein
VPTGRIDLHTHFLPDGYREVLARHVDRGTAEELIPRLGRAKAGGER